MSFWKSELESLKEKNCCYLPADRKIWFSGWCRNYITNGVTALNRVKKKQTPMADLTELGSDAAVLGRTNTGNASN